MRVHITIQYRHGGLPFTSFVECDAALVQEMINHDYCSRYSESDIIGWYIYPLIKDNPK